jgi:hypothetical protein
MKKKGRTKMEIVSLKEKGKKESTEKKEEEILKEE